MGTVSAWCQHSPAPPARAATSLPAVPRSDAAPSAMLPPQPAPVRVAAGQSGAVARGGAARVAFSPAPSAFPFA